MKESKRALIEVSLSSIQIVVESNLFQQLLHLSLVEISEIATCQLLTRKITRSQ